MLVLVQELGNEPIDALTLVCMHIMTQISQPLFSCEGIVNLCHSFVEIFVCYLATTPQDCFVGFFSRPVLQLTQLLDLLPVHAF